MKTKISKQNVQDIFELSLAQKGMLFDHLNDSSNGVYNIQLVFDIVGALNINLFKEAIEQVVTRNEVLRSVFSWEIINKPLQIILKKVASKITFLDLTNESENNKHVFWDLYIEKDKNRKFGLATTPVRFGIIKLSEHHYKFHITHHHILYDGWSTGILIKELFLTYRDLADGKDLSEHNKITYKKVQESIKQTLKTYNGSKYWENYLANYQINNLSLEKQFKKTSRDLRKVSVSVNSNLESYVKKNKVTKAAIIYSAYGLLLQKYLFTSDIVFGTTVSSRSACKENADNVIGNFINTIPFRLSNVESKTLKNIVHSVHEELIHRNSHHNTSYFEIKRLINLAHHDELFDSVLVIENYPIDNTILDANKNFKISLDALHENAGIPLHITIYPEDITRMEFTYDSSKFSDETIKVMSSHFKFIINQILENQEILPQDIDLNSTEEVNHLLSLNPSEIEYEEKRGIIDLFEYWAKTKPDKIAVFDHENSITYKKINEKVNQLANLLIEKKVNQGDTVGVLMDRSIDFVICVFAILKAGGSYLPLPLNYPSERLNYMLKNSKAAFILCDESFTKKDSIEMPCSYYGYSKDQDLITYDKNNITDRILNDVYVIYTSGSTGVPKGVRASQDGLMNRLFWGWNEYPVKESEIHCFKTNIGFVDHVVELFSPLLSGISLRVLNEEEILNIPGFFEILVNDKITRLTLVPSYLTSLLETKKNHKEEIANKLSLQYVFSSGEYLPFQLAKEFYRELPKTQLINIYGSSEVGADATYYNVERYYVEDILRYFTDPNMHLDHVKNEEFEDYITRPDIEIEALTDKFRNYKIPDYPSSPEEYYANFKKNILPYSINTASPKFIGHMTSVLPDYVHDMSKLISQLNQNLVKIETSKSLTFMEREAIAMLHKLFYGFSNDFYSEHVQKLNSNMGIVTSGGSTANISSLLNARNKLLFDEDENKGKSVYKILQKKGYEDMVILGSRLMHYSIDKAASLLGLGTKNIIHLKDTPEGKLDIEDLKSQINYCKKQNLLIIALVGIAGSTETGRIDPLREMGEIAISNGIHFHVDAAWGGLLKFSDKYEHLIEGIELADSITFCGHKQLFLPQGISVCLFKDPSKLSYNATQARYQATANSFDFGRYTPNGSRSALSVCLHGALNIFGKKGYGLLMEKGIELANVFASIIANTEGFELITKHINIINYRYIPIHLRNRQSPLKKEEVDELNEINTKIQKEQFLKGNTFVSKTRIKQNDFECVVFRVVLSNPLTKIEDLESVILDQFVIIEKLFQEKNSFSVKYDKINSTKEDNKIEFNEPEIRSIPIGTPISNTQIVIVNKHNQLQVKGFAGEICISGKGVATGYVDEVSSFKYTQINGKQYYRTGDIGKWTPDGNIDFLGRADLQIKLRGQRIELSEIESCLTSHKDIELSTVKVLGKYVSASLVGYYQSKKQIENSELIDFLAEKLPPHMIPVNYIWLEKVPLLPNGKVDRNALPNDVITSGISYTAPSSSTEKELCAIWLKILELEEDFFGVNTSFFTIGGHSLNAIVLINEVQRKYELEISLRDIFLKNTISSLAELIDTRLWILNEAKFDDAENDKVLI